MLGIIAFLVSLAATAGLVGEVDKIEQGTAETSWIVEWWAYPAITIAVLVATWSLGHLFVTLAATVATGHGIGILIAIPYGLIALDSATTPLGAIIAFPFALFALLGNNKRYNMARDAGYLN